MVMLSEGPRRKHVNPYHVLQVRSDATLSEIRQHYRRLALWHHPGRCATSTNDRELQRRAQVFEILAACYETLVYHRNEYNTCLHSLNHSPLKGEIHVGGKRMIVFGSVDEDYEVAPALALSSSSDSEDDEHGRHDEMKEGPMALLYRARHYEPFTNPYDVFEEAFGHAVFPRPTESEQQQHHSNWVVFVEPAAQLPAIWTGSTVKRRDGTVVSYRSRVLYSRKVTRIETTSVDEKGRKRVNVQVTSEPVSDVDDAVVSKRACKCCPSTAEQISVDEASFCSWPEMNDFDLASPCRWLWPTAAA